MERLVIDPRPNWSAEVEKLGFNFYHTDGVPYWYEGAYYRFTTDEVHGLKAAANDLHDMCMAAVDNVIRNRLYPLMGISLDVGRLIEASWERGDPEIHSRMDFIDDEGIPKLLEINAVTPGALFEASVVQANWRDCKFPETGQFNGIHQRFVDRWRRLMVGRLIVDPLYVTTATPNSEGEHTVQYMGVCAEEAGWKVKFIPIQEIGWNRANFTDIGEQPIRQAFKLYPWDWFLDDTNNLTTWQDEPASLRESGCLWLEPIWKMLMANKGILAVLWDMYPEHPNLLPAYRSDDPFIGTGRRYVRKPVWGQGGQNIQILDGTMIVAATGGSYDVAPFLYHGFAQSQSFDGNIPNLGIWMAGEKACGMGIRESDSLIVTSNSRFVPHIIGMSHEVR